MSLFGPNRPKGITKEELIFVRGELANAPFGHAAEKLTSTQLDEIMSELSMGMDADSAADLHNHWSQVGEQEAKQIEVNAAANRGIKFSPAQLAHIKAVFDKYLLIDKHKSIF